MELSVIIGIVTTIVTFTLRSACKKIQLYRIKNDTLTKFNYWNCCKCYLLFNHKRCKHGHCGSRIIYTVELMTWQQTLKNCLVMNNTVIFLRNYKKLKRKVESQWKMKM